jgi:alpha-L-fucosidase
MYKGKKVKSASEWLQLRAKIHVAEYAEFKEKFTADKFDADAIADMAVAAEMKYINITTRHHDSFCLWNTAATDFSCVTSPAKRDIIGELAAACRKRGLGLCFYYSHGRDWRHPHAPNNDRWGGKARPDYSQPEPFYKYGKEHDLQKYVAFMKTQITELLTNYGPVAAIWLDGIGVPLNPKPGSSATEFHCQELYDHIHSLQPQVLVSYKQGLLGTEDFKAPEHKAVKSKNNTPVEICTTLQRGSWGFKQWAPWRPLNQALTTLGNARKANANLLLNVGPKADGSIAKQAEQTLRAMGESIRKNGWPTA